MTSAESAMLTQPQVAAADYVELSRLVIEAAWRVDIGRADTLHELFTDDGVLGMGNDDRRSARRDISGENVRPVPAGPAGHISRGACRIRRCADRRIREGTRRWLSSRE
jgi:hypothetical protein